MTHEVTAIVENESTDTTSDAVEIPKEFSRGSDELLVQIDITGVGSVALEGRVSDKAAWVTIFDSKVASELIPIAWVPFLRVVTSGAGSPTPNISVRVLRPTR